MTEDRIAKRYAHSLYMLAAERNETELFRDEFRSLIALVRESRDLELFLQNPIISRGVKRSTLEKIFSGKASEPVAKLINLLAQKGREGLLPLIAKMYIREYNANNNITPVTLVSAIELPDSEQQTIKQRVEKILDTSVELSTEVDESLIGGFVLKMDDRLFDGSVKHKLRELEQSFREHSQTFISAL